jgi:tetratricopeptide (TPR) repeat protein
MWRLRVQQWNRTPAATDTIRCILPRPPLPSLQRSAHPVRRLVICSCVQAPARTTAPPKKPSSAASKPSQPVERESAESIQRRSRLIATLFDRDAALRDQVLAATLLDDHFSLKLDLQTCNRIVYVLLEAASEVPMLREKAFIFWQRMLKQASSEVVQFRSLQSTYEIIALLAQQGAWNEVLRAFNMLLEKRDSDCGTAIHKAKYLQLKRLLDQALALQKLDMLAGTRALKSIPHVHIDNTGASIRYQMRKAAETIEDALSGGPPVEVTQAPVLQLDRRIHHLAILAYTKLGRIDEAAEVIRKMQRSAALMQLCPNGPTFSDAQDAPKLMPRDAQPNVLSYLLVARGAFAFGQYESARKHFLHGWNEAERDWNEKQMKVRRYLARIDRHFALPLNEDGREEIAPMQLCDLDERTFEHVRFMLQGLIAAPGGEQHQMVPLIDHQHDVHAFPPSDLLHAKALSSVFPAPDDLPSFLHFAHTDIWKLLWASSVINRCASVNAQVKPMAGKLHPSLEKEVDAQEKFDRLILRAFHVYSRNSTWLRRWILGFPPLSLYDRSLSAAAAPSPKFRATGSGKLTDDATSPKCIVHTHRGKTFAVEFPPDNPELILHAHPAATIEIMMRMLSVQHATHSIVSLYQDALVAAYTAANQDVVRRLIEDDTVEPLDPILPGGFQSSLRLKLLRRQTTSKSEVDAIFTVASVPPIFNPPLPPLSPTVHDHVFAAFLRLAAIGGRAGEFVNYLQARAVINTQYLLAPPELGTLFEIHAASALTPSHIRDALEALPPAAWQLSKQIIDQVFKKILLPCLAQKELQAPNAEDPPFLPGVFQISDFDTRSQTQSIYALQMARYFGMRKYAPLVGLYEIEHSLQFDPPLQLTLGQSLHVIQAYSWMGNLSTSLEMLNEYAPLYSAGQKTCIFAFMIHFLETHVLKSMKQSQRKAESGSGRTVKIELSSGTAAAAPTPFSSLPLPSAVPVPSISSMGAPVLSPSGGPAYFTASGFSAVEGAISDVALKANVQHAHLNDAEWEYRAIEMWKQEAMQFFPHLRHAFWRTSTQVSVEPVICDYSEFLQPAPFRKETTAGENVLGALLNKDAPQGGTFSFGMGSPAFSSYATHTSTLAQANGGAQLDPLIHYQLSQIHGLLDQLLMDPTCLRYDPATRICDLRAGISYNQGRCILYLLSLWIKAQTGERQRYEILVPRSLLKRRQGIAAGALDQGDQWRVSDLEHITLRSYTAEYLLSQYFTGGEVHIEVVPAAAFQQTVIDPLQKQPLSSDSQKLDFFGRPFSEQEHVRFVIQWP